MDDGIAYFARAVSYLRIMFIKLSTGVGIIKDSLSVFVGQNKLECFSVSSFFLAFNYI
jgi:hypothetical protein